MFVGAGFNSMGIASGRAYCGIIGASVRREYTLIGDVVNRAARITQPQSTPQEYDDPPPAEPPRVGGEQPRERVDVAVGDHAHRRPRVELVASDDRRG